MSYPEPPLAVDIESRLRAQGVNSEPVQLRPSQYRVYRWAVAGLCNKEIGEAIGCTEKTVKGHMTAILKVTHLRTRCELIVAHYLDLITVEETSPDTRPSPEASPARGLANLDVRAPEPSLPSFALWGEE